MYVYYPHGGEHFMVRDGVFFPDEVVSRLELNLFDEYRTMVELEGFRYLSIPSLVTRETIERQGVVSWDAIAKVSDTHTPSPDQQSRASSNTSRTSRWHPPPGNCGRSTSVSVVRHSTVG